MSLREELRPRERPLPDLDAEREVDVGRAARQIAARWWLLLAGLAAGIVGGYLLALGGGDFYRAEATLYLGTPFSPTGSFPVQSLQTNSFIVGEIVRDEFALAEAARRSGLRVSELRGEISTKTVSGAAARRTPGQTPLVEISVQGESRRGVARAANALASIVIENEGVSGYVDVKIASFKQQIESFSNSIASLEVRVANLNKALLQAQDEPFFDQLVLISQLDNTVQRRSDVEQQLLATRQQLALAENVERPRVVDPALARKTTARSTRNSIVVGGLIGLLLGALAALLWEPVVERRLRNRSE